MKGADISREAWGEDEVDNWEDEEGKGGVQALVGGEERGWGVILSPDNRDKAVS